MLQRALCFAQMIRARVADGSGRSIVNAMISLLSVAAATLACCAAHPKNDAPQHDLTFQNEVVDNIRRQPIGGHTVDDLNLPEEFLRRLADRIICSSFEETFRIVVGEGGDAEAPQPPATLPAARGTKPSWITVIEHGRDGVIDSLRDLPESRPPLRGFIAPIITRAGRPIHFHEPDDEAPEAVKRAARLVAITLAREGLMVTLARSIETLGPQPFQTYDQTAAETLAAIGLPVDLIGRFKPPEGSSAVEFIARGLAAGRSLDDLKPQMRQMRFEFRKSEPSFEVATESGEHELGLLRLQLTRGSYWQGRGDGGNLDLTRQLLEKMPGVEFLASIESRHLHEFVELAETWPATPAKLTLIAEPMMVAQWAQDNGKPGFARSTGADQRQAKAQAIVTIAPRFASRGEDGAIFVPGENALLQGLHAAGHRIIHSPLLFQGGNLLAIRHPARGERILLIGEAEIHRNTALGLSPEQAIEAFRIEFGVDRCEVLPSVSFHIDFDLTVRARGDRLLAFVPDAVAGAIVVVNAGLDVLERHGLMPAESAAAARKHLANARGTAALAIIKPAIERHAVGPGRFPRALAGLFSAAAHDSGVGNFQTFMLAMDQLAATGLASTPPADVNERAYLEALARRARHRAQLHERLAALGLELIAVPALPDSGRGINPINGIHDRSRYIMPTHGGLYALLDDAARQAIGAGLGGGVAVVEIQCSESQRRQGGVHCSCAAYFRPPRP